MFSVVLSVLIFVSDVQLSAVNPYPDSIATVISGQIGAGTVYDCGDLVEHGIPLEADEYQRYRELFPGSIPVPGNHDYYDDLLEWTWDTHVDAYDQGIHLVGFDSNSWNNPVEHEWLRDHLDDGDSFSLVFMHHPLYSDNARNGGTANVLRPVLLPIIEEGDADFVVSGHGHAFEHHIANGRHFVVIGGGGAPLDDVETSETLVFSSSVHHWMEVTPTAEGIDCEVKNLDGVVFYQFSVPKGGSTAEEKSSWGSVKALYR